MQTLKHNNKPPEVRGPVSTNFAIARINLATHETVEHIPVLASLNGKPVTEDMLKRDVSALNRHAGLNGRTYRPIERTTAYRLEALQVLH